MSKLVKLEVVVYHEIREIREQWLTSTGNTLSVPIARQPFLRDSSDAGFAETLKLSVSKPVRVFRVFRGHHPLSVRAASGRAIIRSVEGAASYFENGKWKPLKHGQSIFPPASVETSLEGKLEIFLGDNGPTLQLLDSTQLQLDRLEVAKNGIESITETRLTLISGTIRGTIRKLPTGGIYEVRALQVVMIPKATPAQFQVSANGKVCVRHGFHRGYLHEPGEPGDHQIQQRTGHGTEERRVDLARMHGLRVSGYEVSAIQSGKFHRTRIAG